MAMITTKKRSANDAHLSIDRQEAKSGDTPYAYGLYNLPTNCRVLKVEVDGQKDLNNVRMDDRIMISNLIETAANCIPHLQQVSRDCGIVIKNTKETMDDITLVEYKVLLQFHPDTVVEGQHIGLLQHVNPMRCGGKDTIKVFYDSTTNKQCLCLTVSSNINPIRLTDCVLIHQHFTTMLYTTDQDDSSSKNQLDEISVNRKRARKNGNGNIEYNKKCDNK